MLGLLQVQFPRFCTVTNKVVMVIVLATTAEVGQTDTDIPGRCYALCPGSSSGSYGIASFWEARARRNQRASQAQTYKKAVPANVRRSRRLAESAGNLLVAASGPAQLLEAIRLYERALEEDPSDRDQHIRMNLYYARTHLGVRYAQLGDFDKALPLLRAAATRDPKFRQAVMGVEKQAALNEMNESALAHSPQLAPDYTKHSRTEQERKRETIRTALKDAGEDDYQRPPEPFGISGSVPANEAGVEELDGREAEITDDRDANTQRDSAVHHGQRAVFHSDPTRNNLETAHNEATRPFDRSGETQEIQDVQIPSPGPGEFVDARGVSLEVPESLLEEKHWLDLREEENQLSEDISRHRQRIETLQQTYGEQRAGDDAAAASRTLVKIALTKQKEKQIVDKFADVKRQQHEAIQQRQQEEFDDFGVDVWSPKKDEEAAPATTVDP